MEVMEQTILKSFFTLRSKWSKSREKISQNIDIAPTNHKLFKNPDQTIV